MIVQFEILSSRFQQAEMFQGIDHKGINLFRNKTILSYYQLLNLDYLLIVFLQNLKIFIQLQKPRHLEKQLHQRKHLIRLFLLLYHRIQQIETN